MRTTQGEQDTDWLAAPALDEDEHAPHILLVVDPEWGVGPAAGPVVGALDAMAAAERMEAVLNEDNDGARISVRIVRLYGPPAPRPG